MIELYAKQLGLRKGQFIFNFLWWLQQVKNYDTEIIAFQPSSPVHAGGRMADPFYISNEDFDNLLEEYVNGTRNQIGKERKSAKK